MKIFLPLLISTAAAFPYENCREIEDDIERAHCYDLKKKLVTEMVLRSGFFTEHGAVASDEVELPYRCG